MDRPAPGDSGSVKIENHSLGKSSPGASPPTSIKTANPNSDQQNIMIQTLPPAPGPDESPQFPIASTHARAGMLDRPNLSRQFSFAALLAGLLMLLFGAQPARAQQVPPGCTGSGLGINLFTSSPDVHIGDTITYSVNVFNGIAGTGRIVCDAINIRAFIVTPDGLTNFVTLRRTTLHNGESDFYPDVASYVVRAQDLRPDGSVRATASDVGVILQNDTPSEGGGDQGVNTEVSLPCIQIGVVCLPGVGANGAILFTGSVTNCGNNTLVGVGITNFVNGVDLPVAFVTQLARGEVATFSGSWIPADPCAPSTARLTAHGTDQFTTHPRTVAALAETTCQNALTPGIRVTQLCPVGPISPGQLLVYSGTVTNTGNVTLTNVVVISDHPANTTVFTIASLAPGAGSSFTGSYTAPVDCSVTSGLVGRGTSVCGVLVTDTASITCPIVTAPAITVTTLCSPISAIPGGIQFYSGTVRNSGDIPLKNVVVLSDRPSANTTVFTIASLAPGASAGFTNSYTVPLVNACAVTTTVVATGQDVCTDRAVTSTSSVTCSVVTNPLLALTLNCPVDPSTAGGPITFTGTVRNTGNVTLTNVTVVNAQATPSTVLTVASLAPGASANFTASFTAPADACAVSTTVNASGADSCSAQVVTATQSATCPLLTTALLVITQTCPVVQVAPGGLLTYSGTVRNTGNVTVTNVIVRNSRSGVPPVFTAATLAPGATVDFNGTFTVPLDVCAVSSTSTVTATSVCGVAVSSEASATCTVLTTPLITATTVCSTNVIAPGGLVSYTGTVRNGGDVTLNNVVVTSDRPAAGTVLFTVATLAPGASANFSGSYTAPATFPLGACGVTATVTATGKNVCTDLAVSVVNTATCAITTTPLIAVTLNCPTVPVAVGGLITYSGTVTNPGNVTLNNVTVVNAQASPSTVFTVATLAPGASANFTTQFTAPADVCDVTATVVASGADNCSGVVVNATRSATCLLVGSSLLIVTQDCPVEPTAQGGTFTYTGTVYNGGNLTLTNVIVTDDRTGIAGPAITTLWFDDELPADASESNEGTPWSSITSNPTPVSGSHAFQTVIRNGSHQHFFTGADTKLNVGAGDVLIASVYLDPANLPSELLIQWNDGTWDHRAYWGTNLIGFPGDGTERQRYMGPLPPAGQWVRLEVPASLVGLENQTVRGFAFALFNGRATFDAVGKISGALNPTEVFRVATLEPGETARFTGSYSLSGSEACAVTTRLIASGNEKCAGVAVLATSIGTCPLVTAPAIEVTLICPASPSEQGGLLTYTGTVRNTGNVTLNNVAVRNNRSGPTPIFTVASLAPGATANFTGSYRVPVDCCAVSSTVTGTGADNCTGAVVSDTATSTCIVLTTPQLAVTKNCPALPVAPGEMLKFTGTVSNTGNVTLVDVWVFNNRIGSTPLIGPLTLAPGETANYSGSYIYRADYCGSDTITAQANSICDVPITAGVTSICPVAPTIPGIAVTKNCPLVAPRYGEPYTFTGTVFNTGNVTLIDVYVVNNQPSNNTPVIGPITLAPGASANFTASFMAPMDCCEITETVTARGHDLCSGNTVTARASTACPMLTTPRLAVSEVCPTSTGPVGGLYKFTGSITNIGDVNLTNVMVFSIRTGGSRVQVLGPVELAPGETSTYSGSYTVTTGSEPSTDIIEVTGMDTCQARLVIARANCSGPLAPSVEPRITSITQVNGLATVTWNSTPGVTYTLQCKGSFENPIWINVPGNVTAAGSSAAKSDQVSPSAKRFYRVIAVE